MGFILLGIVLTIAVVILFAWLDWDFSGDFISGIATILFLAGLFCGLVSTPLGYTDYEIIEEIPLVSFGNSTVSQDKFYVSISENNNYLYCYEVESEFAALDDEVYSSKSISGNIEVIESDNVKIPVLQKYEKHGIKSFWSFAILHESYKYVFIVPKGSVIYDVGHMVLDNNVRYEAAG